jgi:hypothetical protein
MPRSGDAAAAYLQRQRWEILDTAKPRHEVTDPMPGWVKTPEDYVRWLASVLSLNELYGFFRDLETSAKINGDLALLRFARRYRKFEALRDLIEDHERL